ncbi:MAG: hypothetical protein EAZ53_13550 [Bacteroidetes bacterium]|nr:MAG: hypothetical protein EAZ53_13550 [Bacteroidota bacterium]
MNCELKHIPERLHSKNRNPVQFFNIGEVLFRRCKLEEKLNPFDYISVYDISVNRRGYDTENIFSEPEDVLFNFGNFHSFVKYDEQTFICLEIKELNESYQYEKLSDTLLPTHNIAKIFLNHRIEPCNYSHCCFEIYFNNIEMKDKTIYDKHLKKDSILKTWCKNELAKMMIKEEIRLNW